MQLGFGDCRLDVQARRLFRRSREVHLSPKSFELLKVLVESRPRALSKAELLERVWPGVFVSDASLARAVSELRDAIGDGSGAARSVRTVHAFGYAFVADVVEDSSKSESAKPASTGSCWLILSRRRFALAEGTNIIGRDPTATVFLDSPKVSRRHASIVVKGLQATIEDLDSKNGTLVDGVAIKKPAALESGRRIEVGPFVLTFRAVSASCSTETAL